MNFVYKNISLNRFMIITKLFDLRPIEVAFMQLSMATPFELNKIS